MIFLCSLYSMESFHLSEDKNRSWLDWCPTPMCTQCTSISCNMNLSWLWTWGYSVLIFFSHLRNIFLIFSTTSVWSVPWYSSLFWLASLPWSLSPPMFLISLASTTAPISLVTLFTILTLTTWWGFGRMSKISYKMVSYRHSAFWYVTNAMMLLFSYVHSCNYIQ